VEYAPWLENDMKKLDRQTLYTIKKWIDENLEGCEDPRRSGKALAGIHSGKWRYRVGDHRIIAKIEYGRLIITIISIIHRRNAYK
jgi:mRNA interferase RelE/StbE